MKREISPGLAIGIIVGLIVVVVLGNWAWKGLFRAKKANIVFHSNGAMLGGGTLSPRDRMLLQIYQSARTVGGNAPPTTAPPPPTSPASRTP